jgi:hypothetical protein
MTIIELGALGEFVGAILLCASIIFVGLQIRQNTNATKAQVFQARSDQAMEHYKFLSGSEARDVLLKMRIDDPNYGGKGFVTPDLGKLTSLSDKERMLYVALMNAGRIRLENVFYQYQAGFLEQDFYQSLVETILEHARIWEALGINISAGFKKEIDRLRASPLA